MATYEDARLIIEFSKWAQEWKFHEANDWIRQNRPKVVSYEAFKESCPRESDGFKNVHTVLGFYENLGLFYRHNVIDQDLLFDWLNFVTPWEVLQQVVMGLRGRPESSATLWENFEELAAGQRKHRSAKLNG